MDEARFCIRCGTALVTRESGGRFYPSCPVAGCGWTAFGNPTPVVAALVETPAGVVLVRNRGWPEKWYGLVSGFVEHGEEPDDAVVREVREELGLEGEVVSLIGVYGFSERNELIVAYHVRAAGSPVPGDEIAGVRVIPVERLRPWPVGTGRAVADWLARRGA